MRFTPIYYKQLTPYQKFILMGGNNFLYSNLNLSSNSLVVILGGYQGYSAFEYSTRYDCKVKVFEPVNEYFKIARTRLAELKMVECINLAVTKNENYLRLFINGDATGLILQSGTEKSALFDAISIADFIEKVGNEVDLLEINIEGGEFEILPDLVESKSINIQTLLIQFHKINAESDNKRLEIHTILKRNQYEMIFDFEYVWERWEKKSSMTDLSNKVSLSVQNTQNADLICIERNSSEQRNGH